jgi:hypothetical protein
MSRLFLFIGENIKFDKSNTIEVLKSIDGISNAKEGKFIGSVFECEFDRGSYHSSIRLKEDLETITIDGLSDESLLVALKVRDGLDHPLSIIDTDYSFHIDLSTVDALQDLKDKINVGHYDG